MNATAFREALGRRQPVFGSLVVSPSPVWLNTVSGLGLDYVFIDTEHIPIDRQTLSWMCRAYEAAGIAPMVRIPSPDPYAASMALDGGAAAILAPYIETVEQVQALVGAVKHKPVKGARLADMLAAPDSCPEQRAYAEAVNAGHSLLINVESVPAMERLDDLLAVPGLDGIIIGPHDLSVSLGVPEQWTHPRFASAVETILDTARRHGISAGMHVIYDDGPTQYARWRDAGATIILHLADILAFRFMLQRELDDIRAIMGPTATANGAVNGAVGRV